MAVEMESDPERDSRNSWFGGRGVFSPQIDNAGFITKFDSEAAAFFTFYRECCVVDPVGTTGGVLKSVDDDTREGIEQYLDLFRRETLLRIGFVVYRPTRFDPWGMRREIVDEGDVFPASDKRGILRCIRAGVVVHNLGDNRVARVLIFNPESRRPIEEVERKICPLVDMSYERVAGTRIEGWKLAYDVLREYPDLGVRLPEGIGVVDMFKDWYEQKKKGGGFSDRQKELILSAASRFAEMGFFVVRRAHAIPGEIFDPGRERQFIPPTSSELAVKAVELVYEEALSIIERRAEGILTEEGVDVEVIVEKLVEQSKVFAVLQRFVDPVEIRVVGEPGNWQVEIGETERLPAAASLIPLPGGVMAMMGFGNTRGLAEQGNRITFGVSADGRVYYAKPREVLKLRLQDSMLCAVGSGEAWLPVPQRKRQDAEGRVIWPVTPKELEHAVEMVIKMSEVAREQGLANEHWLIEISMGLGIGKSGEVGIYPYLTQAIPYDVEKGLFRAVEVEGFHLLIQEQQDLEELEAYLGAHPEETVLVGVPTKVVIRENPIGWDLLRLLAGRENVVVLAQADFATGHLVNDLMGEGISFHCVGRFPIEEFDRRAMSFMTPDGIEFDVAEVSKEGQWVLSLKDAWRYGRRECGMKAFNISLVERAGLPVAPGCLLIASLFEEILTRIDLAEDFGRLKALGVDDRGVALELAGKIRERFYIPDDLMEEVITQLKEAFGGKIPSEIMARSSAGSEDHLDISAAGVYESRGERGGLGVDGLKGALEDVYRSLFSERAIKFIYDYIKLNPDLLRNMSMSVLVPQYIPIREGKDLSFVMFTADREIDDAVRLSIAAAPCAEIVGGSMGGAAMGGDIVFRRTDGAILRSTLPRNNGWSSVGEAAVAAIMERDLITQMERIGGEGGPADVEGFLYETAGGFIAGIFQLRPLVSR